MSHLSPSSSPRLPSPPPMAENQIGPISPTSGTSEDKRPLEAPGHVDENASRRIRPGTKAADMCEGPPLVKLTDIDSAFQLTEHLKAIYFSITHLQEPNLVVPIDHSMATRIAHPPKGIDGSLWLYELCRFLSQKTNLIVISLFADDPPCSRKTCSDMRASEWQYLCAVHESPKPCCAIDYCCHTLDWAANMLTSPKHFPSRLSMGMDMHTVKEQNRHLTNIIRRVYRIFAHAWFQHREVFWKVENRTGLYILFKTVIEYYQLLPRESYIIPLEAEGIDTSPALVQQVQPQSIFNDKMHSNESHECEDRSNGAISAAKRYKSAPSVASVTSVSTVIEETEEGFGSKNDEPVPKLVDEDAPSEHNSNVSESADNDDTSNGDILLKGNVADMPCEPSAEGAPEKREEEVLDDDEKAKNPGK